MKISYQSAINSPCAVTFSPQVDSWTISGFGEIALIVLKEAYDEATPRVLSQWWYDRRNNVQWYTFWVAIMVFVVTTTLGIIQCIEGGLQLSRNRG